MIYHSHDCSVHVLHVCVQCMGMLQSYFAFYIIFLYIRAGIWLHLDVQCTVLIGWGDSSSFRVSGNSLIKRDLICSNEETLHTTSISAKMSFLFTLMQATPSTVLHALESHSMNCFPLAIVYIMLHSCSV